MQHLTNQWKNRSKSEIDDKREVMLSMSLLNGITNKCSTQSLMERKPRTSNCLTMPLNMATRF